MINKHACFLLILFGIILPTFFLGSLAFSENQFSMATSSIDEDELVLVAATEGGQESDSAQTDASGSEEGSGGDEKGKDSVPRSPAGKPLPAPEEILKRKPETKTQGYFGPSFGEGLLKLGTEEDFTAKERYLIKAQIKSFIPPLLQSAIVGDAYVLPPNTFRVTTNFRFTNITAQDDIFGASGVGDLDGIRRIWADLTFLYGFDLHHKFLHSFTASLTIPYRNNATRGSVFPPSLGGGTQIFNTGSSQGIGPISLKLKKKIIDQANFPVGIATVGEVYFPTGSNEEKFGANGLVPCAPTGGTGCATGNTTVTRFSPDGRFPAFLQPGWGNAWSFLFGGFLTRQLLPTDLPFLSGTPLDRGAIHAGGTYRWNFRSNGFNPGNQAVGFISIVEPLYKDFLSLELTNRWEWNQRDSYTFADRPRAPFRNGVIGMIGPSLIFSPDPLIRLRATYLSRIHAPALGPAPPFIFNIGMDVTF